ncbi:MAG: EamA family transporter [Actinobacteria bacterium]|nr:EamA family transporter [Actinomycetota bacterium]
MGELLGIASGMFYGLSSVLFRIGMRHRKNDNGLFMGVFMNILLLGPLMFLFERKPANWKGVVLFLLAGLFAPWLARASMLRAVRLIGPVRSNAFMLGAPLVTVAISSTFLGEEVGLLEAVGGCLVLGGLAVAGRSGRSTTAVGLEIEGTAAVGSELPDDAGSMMARSEDWPRGRFFAGLAAFLMGMGLVVRKMGLDEYSDPVAGAFLASLAALVMILTETTLKGRLGQLRNENFSPIPWWFVGAGFAAAAAILTQFTAMLYLPIWMVSVLLSTHGLWTYFWSHLLLHEDEEMQVRVLAAILVSTIGIVVLAWPA